MCLYIYIYVAKLWIPFKVIHNGNPHNWVNKSL